MDILDARYIISTSLKEKSFKEKSISEKKQLLDEAFKAFFLYRIQYNQTSHYKDLKVIADSLSLLELLDRIEGKPDLVEEEIITQMMYCLIIDAEFLRGWSISYQDNNQENSHDIPTNIYNEEENLYRTAINDKSNIIKSFKTIHNTYFDEILTEENVKKLLLK